MTLLEQINAVDCTASGVLGTGLAGCRKDRNRITALGLLERGTKFTELITKEYMRTLQQEGKLIMLQDVVSFTDQTADDNIITRPGSGVKKLAGKNPYEYAVMFDNGIAFHKALTTLESYNQYDLVLFDVTNSMFFTVTKTGEAKGFTMGMFNNGKYMGADGAEASSYTVTLQLTERMEIDKQQSWISSENLDFAVSELTGVNQVNIQLEPVVAAATTIVLSAKLASDNSHSVIGLLVPQTKFTRNGAPLVPTAVTYDANTKLYTFTVAPIVAADVITASLNGIVLTLNDDLYKSNTDTAIAA